MTMRRKALPALRRQIGALLWCGAVLTGCSYIAPAPPPPPQPAPQPLPSPRQIIANSTDVLFDAAANPRNVTISDLRRFDAVLGSEFGVCLRASVTDRGGKRHIATYVVFVSSNKVTDRRRALPADGCDRETYQPL
jgi:hypothetical protein